MVLSLRGMGCRLMYSRCRRLWCWRRSGVHPASIPRLPLFQGVLSFLNAIDHVLPGYVKPYAPPTIPTYQPGLVAPGLYNDPLVGGRIQRGAGVGCV